MTFSIDNPEGGLQQPPLRKICLGKTLRRTRVKRPNKRVVHHTHARLSHYVMIVTLGLIEILTQGIGRQ